MAQCARMGPSGSEWRDSGQGAGCLYLVHTTLTVWPRRVSSAAVVRPAYLRGERQQYGYAHALRPLVSKGRGMINTGWRCPMNQAAGGAAHPVAHSAPGSAERQPPPSASAIGKYVVGCLRGVARTLRPAP